MEKISGKYTIKQIFQKHWPDYLAKHPEVPDYVIESVEKMFNCRDPEKLGYTKVACSDHPECYTVIPHSCKSRFCNACGKVATDNWLSKACADFPNVRYVHVTFTVPSELRELFLTQPETRKILFEITSQIVLGWCKDRGWKPAITAVLHTFGRDLKFHPHLHMLVSAGGLDIETESKWVDCSYLPENMLKIRWRSFLLRHLYKERLINQRLKQQLSRIKWYVYVAQQLLIAVVTTNYVGRYTKRPPLAEARILDYDGQLVTFCYEDWNEDKTRKNMTFSVEYFITRLIQHLPPKHFRLIKHYGLLHNRQRGKYLPILKQLFGQIKTYIQKTTWRIRQKLFKKTDPLLCPKCKREMKPVEIAFWSRRWQCLWIKPLA